MYEKHSFIFVKRSVSEKVTGVVEVGSVGLIKIFRLTVQVKLINVLNFRFSYKKTNGIEGNLTRWNLYFKYIILRFV